MSNNPQQDAKIESLKKRMELFGIRAKNISTVEEVIFGFARNVIALMIIGAFAYVTIRVLGLTSDVNINNAELVGFADFTKEPQSLEELEKYAALRDQLISQNEKLADTQMAPLNFVADFLAGFILPVVTLIIGFYFGKEIGETKSKV